MQLALLPFLVVYFHRLSFASFVLNIGVSLMMAGLAILAAVALLVAQVSSTLAAPLISVTNSLNWAMVHSVDPFAKVGVASIRLPEYTGWAAVIYGLYYLPLVSLAISLSRWRPLQISEAATQCERGRPGIPVCSEQAGTSVLRRVVWLALAAQLLAIALVVIHPFSAGRPNGKLRIDFLDVGQGDSALITFPDNTTLLVDGGGKPGPFQQDRISAEVNDDQTSRTRNTEHW